MTRRWVTPAYALALVLAITAPLFAPGYLLLRDAVSTPRSYLSDEALGLGESAPRALPQDFAVALASHLIDGGVVVKALLILGLWLAGWGAARLASRVVPEAGPGGEFVAATVAIWNPYVAERLLQGHWSLLVGYGCLPWVAAAMLELRDSPRARWWPLVFWVALAGLTPTGLLLAAAVAVVCIAVPGDGRSRVACASVTCVVGVAVALPWLAASVVAHSLSSSQAGIAPFAARAEPALSTLGSLAAFGGIWNSESVPGSRTTAFAVVGSALLLAIVLVGLPTLRRRPAAMSLLGLALVAVVMPAAMATGPGMALVDAVVRALPGVGVVRDGQKWVALAMPGYAVGAAGGVLTLTRWSMSRLREERQEAMSRLREERRAVPAYAVAAVCCVALIAVLPDLAWGVGGKVAPVRYPSGWAAVASRINADPRPVAVLPADTMRKFAWSGPAPVLDPLPRWVRAHVWSTGDLTISGRTVVGEGTRARRVQQLLLEGAAPSALAGAGVGWVVVESDSAGGIGSAANTLTALPVVYRDADITLYRVGGDSAGASSVQRAVMVSAHLVWLIVLAAGAAGSAVLTVRRRHAGQTAGATEDR
ncbi:MAG: hypothetical protein QOH57_4996 [Mycobacterium sp.]|nr:hypothetical protein [Mycobacterium sp.]